MDKARKCMDTGDCLPAILAANDCHFPLFFLCSGEGDLHQTSYDKYRRFCSLTATGLYTENSPTYKLSLYPNDELYAVYSTNNPTVATIGAVCIILITSMVFFLYDFFVRREFHAKKELLRAKRQFMRFVSHEVRTPLNSVCMGLTLIMEELEASIGYDASSAAAINNNQDETVPLTTNTNSTQQGNAFHGNKSQWFLLAKEIQTNAQGAVDVLNDLLNYDKIEQGTLLLELTILPIWQLIAQAADEFKLPAAMKKLNFEMCFNVPEEHAPISSVEGLPEEVRNLKVIGDAVRLTQVLRNLISNALKFTPEGGSLRVQASWVNSKQVTMKDAALDRIALKDEKCVSGQRRGHLQVTVEDSGAGMSQDQLAKLFRDGVQFNANELQAGNGTGLGLYIAKGIVEQHQGNLVAVSEGLQQGTTFTMTLPFWHIPEIECSSNGVDTDVSVGTGTLEPIVELAALRVLIVDDASSNRKLLNRLLSNGGHICDEAENGAVAVDMVARAIEAGDPYDTVLLDYEMPVMRGPEAAKELRRVGSDVYIVGITGNMLPEDVAYFKSCGANAVLPKPFKIAELTSLWMEFGLDGNSQRV
jgi:signal transduction histidine kinase/CheY-like chemotaxis protein